MAIAKQKIGAIAIAALISANMGVTAFASEESITPPDRTAGVHINPDSAGRGWVQFNSHL